MRERVVRERRWQLRIDRHGLMIDSIERGMQAPVVLRRATPSRLSWALPMLATVGVAFAFPIDRRASGEGVTLLLEEPTKPVRAKPRSAPVAVAAQPAAAQVTVALAPPERLPQLPTRDAALSLTMADGEARDWSDGAGGGGIVVAGPYELIDGLRCRNVVVMTRRSDGPHDNASGVKCEEADLSIDASD